MNFKINIPLFSVFCINKQGIIDWKYSWWILIFLLGWSSSIKSNCHAQTINTIEAEGHQANTLLSQVNQEPLTPPSPIPDEAIPEKTKPPTAPIAPEDEAIPITVKNITVTGSTIFQPKDFQPIVKPLQGKKSSLAELKSVADRITQLYLKEGYITSRAVVVSDSLDDGEVEIEIIEGTVEQIRVVGADRLVKYVRSRVNLGAGTPLNTSELEEQLKLLKIDPLIKNIEAKISAGKGIGQSTIVVRVEAAQSLGL